MRGRRGARSASATRTGPSPCSARTSTIRRRGASFVTARRGDSPSPRCAERTVDLRGRGALVTGGSGSLGSAISVALAEAGCDIAIGYGGNREGADDTVRAVEKLG